MNTRKFSLHVALVLTLTLVLHSTSSAASNPVSLWDLAQKQRSVHRFSTLFTAQNVRDHLGTEDGLNAAVDWCRQTAVTKVYLEVFRDSYRAERATLERARETFRKADIEASGCVTTTGVGKPSNRWRTIACYTDAKTQENLQSIFEYAASLFDEVMIDDFWFTDCSCLECDQARTARRVVVGDKITTAPGDSWEDYRCELMVRLSRERVLAPARRINPNVKFIIKYPQWYDLFHERGYEVVRQTADFDRIWVGTETRDYGDKRWGGTVQYEAYFIMRWLGGIGGDKCGGGWFDPYGTTESTYLEQARQTVLGGARESLLFCYGSLQRETGPKNIDALRTNLTELFRVAAEVRHRDIVGLAAYKPPNSHPENEPRVFDFVGMLGLPLVPCHEFPEAAPAAFFSIHALNDADLTEKLRRFIAAGKPVLLTDGLAERLRGKVDLSRSSVQVIAVKGDPKSLLTLNQKELDALRQRLLDPFKASFKAPNKVGLYLFRDGSWVVENFNDASAAVELNGQMLDIPARGWRYEWK